MKIDTFEDRIHMLNSHSDVWSVIRNITEDVNQEEAFYVCDIGDIVNKYDNWCKKLPRVVPYYAVKCNDSPIVLQVLASLGTNFDCASKGEISKVLSMGVNPKNIIFANPAKPASHIRHAAAVGVDVMTFDNEAELHKVKKLYPDAKMVIRIRSDATAAQCQLGMKFGCDALNDVPDLLALARQLDIDVIGVSFHVGSGCGEPDAFRRAIELARRVFDTAEGMGFKFELLDIGGGYPGGHGTSIDKIANVINSALSDHFPDPSIKIIAEPGRYFVSSAYTLVCNVHSIRNVVRPHPVTGELLTHRMYYINDGVYGSFNCILYDHQAVVAQPLNDRPGSKYYSSSIWGPTCDGLDQVIEDIMLPDLKIGDWIVFEDMGAYTLPVASTFNGFPIPKVHIVADENTWNLMNDIMAFSEEHFEMIERPRLNSVSKKRNSMPPLPITIEIPRCNGNMIEECVLDYIEPGPVE